MTLLMLFEKVGGEKCTFEMRFVREQRVLLPMCSAKVKGMDLVLWR